MKKEDLIAVIVWTKNRDIKFGYLPVEMARTHSSAVTIWFSRSITRYNMRQVHGPSGLATHGVGDSGRVGAECPEETVHDVASIMACTEEAIASIEAEPWTS